MIRNHSVLDLKVRATDVGTAEDIVFVAPADVLPRLAAAIGVDRVLTCEAKLHVVAEGDGADVTGVARAKIVQTCIVSLEPFETVIEEPIDVRFAPESEAAPAPATSETDEEGSAGMADGREPIVDGVMNLGSLIQELLALGVDRYPRKPGATFEPLESDADAISPFAALARFRKPGTDA